MEKQRYWGMHKLGCQLVTRCAGFFFNPKGDTTPNCSELQFPARLWGPRLMGRSRSVCNQVWKWVVFLQEVHAGIFVYWAGAGRRDLWQPSLFASPNLQTHSNCVQQLLHVNGLPYHSLTNKLQLGQKAPKLPNPKQRRNLQIFL